MYTELNNLNFVLKTQFIQIENPNKFKNIEIEFFINKKYFLL